MEFDKMYYCANTQDRDRPALWFYERLWRRYCLRGPVLEFGCGVGYLAKRLSKYTEVFGLEINEYAVRQLAINAPNVKCIRTVEEIPDGSLGSVVALHVLEHIAEADLIGLGAEFKRILAAGGKGIFVMPDLGGYPSKIKKSKWMGLRDKTHINLKTAEQWYSLFTTSWGFNVVKCSADGYYDFPYGDRLGGIIGDGTRALKTGLQFALARPILRPGDGEAVIFIVEKRE